MGAFGGGAHLRIGYRFAEAQVRSIMPQMLLSPRWSVPNGYRTLVQQAPGSKPLDELPVFLESVAWAVVAVEVDEGDIYITRLRRRFLGLSWKSALPANSEK